LIFCIGAHTHVHLLAKCIDIEWTKPGVGLMELPTPALSGSG